MAVLQVLSEEEIREDRFLEYVDDLYKIVCVGERSEGVAGGGLVRTTYVVDWEQLVHLLEDYSGFGEDIVQVAPLSRDEETLFRYLPEHGVARA